MVKPKGTYCDLLSYLSSSDNKDHKALYELVDDLCWRSIFTTRRDYTFLMPSKELIKKLADTAENNEDEGYENLRRLFINDKHDDLGDADELITFNNKKIKKDFHAKLAKLKKISISGLKQAVVFDYNGEELPDQENERVKRVPKPKKGKGEDDNTYDYTKELFSTKDSKLVLNKLGSLIEHCKENSPESYNMILKKIDPNWVLSWFILVQPGNTGDDRYIPLEIFKNWSDKCKPDNKNSIDHDGFISALKEVKNPEQELKKANEYREQARELSSADEVIDHIKSSYGSNKLSLYEDELRFRYSNLDADEVITHHIEDLRTDWNNIKDEFVLICSKKGAIIDNDARFACIQSFINSNAFHYVPLTQKIQGALEKISGGIIGGGSRKVLNVLGNANRKALAKMNSGDSKEMLKSLIKSLSTSQKKILKDLL
jgi:hypothetical protein